MWKGKNGRRFVHEERERCGKRCVWEVLGEEVRKWWVWEVLSEEVREWWE